MIFCIIGKSASGKDTLYKNILEKKDSRLVSVIPYTTRPKRVDEKDGVNYHFVTRSFLAQLEASGNVIEKRSYNTVRGEWVYFTARFDVKKELNYILITTPEGVRKIAEFYGSDSVCTVYMDIDDKTRLLRCIDRESQQTSPNYAEVCRRFIADSEDFSPEIIDSVRNLKRIDAAESEQECLAQWLKIYDTAGGNR